MNKFKEKLNELSLMSDEDKNQSLENLKGECICPLCPTYTECAKNADELLFCVTGISKNCINDEIGCLCPSCPFGQKYGIGVVYNLYCTRGSEMGQHK